MRAGDVGRDYAAGIRRAYCGELSASRVYRLLAGQEKYAEHRLKLSVIADVESQTARVLEPIALRLGITCDTGAIEEIVHRRVAELGALSWAQFIEQALVNWPPYIAEFEALAEYSLNSMRAPSGYWLLTSGLWSNSCTSSGCSRTLWDR